MESIMPTFSVSQKVMQLSLFSSADVWHTIHLRIYRSITSATFSMYELIKINSLKKNNIFNMLQKQYEIKLRFK